MFRFLTKIAKNGSLTLMSLIITLLAIVGGFYFYTSINLPDVKKLKNISMQIPLRVYSSDGKLIGEFGEEKRIPTKLNVIPKRLIYAILDTEDQRFFEHRGVDFSGLIRAGISFIATGKKTQGASTITMQVARNFFLNREKTFARKLNEILLAFKIDKNFSKKEILELYLNKIYFGNRAYGVTAAAQVYYGKSLEELTLAEIATIAGLPQAPSRDNPVVNPSSSKKRRNHVLDRMLENSHINPKEYAEAINAPISTYHHETPIELIAPYVAEMARCIAADYYGDGIYEDGIAIFTTIDSKLQTAANQTLIQGLLNYDQRHGYRGAEAKLSPDSTQNQWQAQLKNIRQAACLVPALVTNSNEQNISALLATGEIINITNHNFSWAGPNLNLDKGDVIRVYKNPINHHWSLGQLPQADCAIVAMNPNNGAILAMGGGFSYGISNFNRITQAERQPGSVFKPFIYAAALEKGLTLATIINDAPVVLFDHSTNALWRPQNNSKTFYGPTRLRTALTYSRNLVSIRLLQHLGIDYTTEFLKKFGFQGKKEIPQTLTLALGTGNVTPLKITSGYATFANGGYKIEPFLITKITKSNNGNSEQIIFQANPKYAADDSANLGKHRAHRIIKESTAFLITNVLKEVIEHGTGKRAKILQRDDLAGKTGSTNDLMDGWFVGYNRDLIATVWLGFDKPKSTEEYGAQSALPVWIQFMKIALENKPSNSLANPDDVVTARIDPNTGLLASPEHDSTVFEFFTQDTLPEISSEDETSQLYNQDIDSNNIDEETNLF